MGVTQPSLGIDVDHDEEEIERCALAATLFGTRISAEIAERAFLACSTRPGGIHTISQAGRYGRARLIEPLDAGGYARYDFRTAERLHAIAQALDADDGRVSSLLNQPPQKLVSALHALPGWGPVTVGLFLGELRGVRPGIEPPIDPRALGSAEHLRLIRRGSSESLRRLRLLADDAISTSATSRPRSCVSRSPTAVAAHDAQAATPCPAGALRIRDGH